MASRGRAEDAFQHLLFVHGGLEPHSACIVEQGGMLWKRGVELTQHAGGYSKTVFLVVLEVLTPPQYRGDVMGRFCMNSLERLAPP